MKSLVFLAILLFAPTLSATEPARWQPELKAAAVAGCRASISYHAERDYLKRSQATELPPDFREKAAPVMEPYLAVCDCVYEEFEKMWTYEYYAAHQDEAKSKLEELVTGTCAVEGTKPADMPKPDAPVTE